MKLAFIYGLMDGYLLKMRRLVGLEIDVVPRLPLA
jgi:hypothetical protein